MESSRFANNFYTSHECLLLPYESSQTRYCQIANSYYDTSAHFLWIGDRTRSVNEGHVEFCRGIRNPVGIKVGPSSNPHEIRDVVLKLNPLNILGRVTIITRFGIANIQKCLPLLVNALGDLQILWECDPMHGNTYSINADGRIYKTRNVDDIMNEVVQFINIMRSKNTIISGIHLETTGDPLVTECIGMGIDKSNIHTHVWRPDPSIRVIE